MRLSAGGALARILAITASVASMPSALGAVQASKLQSASPSRKLHGRFLHVTDFHPDEFYRLHSATDGDDACHSGKGSAGTYGAEKTDCDSPFALVDATLEWIAKNIKDDIDFVVWTGDSARHDSDETHPRNASGVLESNRAVADKFVETFSSADGRLNVPVIPTFGNNDFLPHNIMNPGPNRWFQSYGDIWRRFIPEDQRHAFQYGGWYYVEVIPDKLAVFSLNTMFFFERNAAVDGCAEPSEPGFKHMEWLRIHLQSMRQRGMKAILMGHVPPARTDSKRNWDETCWQKYTLWLRQYRDVVTASLFGHMNIDHFLLQDTQELDIAGMENALRARSLHERHKKRSYDDLGDEDEGEDEDDEDEEEEEEDDDDEEDVHFVNQSNGGFSIKSKSEYLLELRELWSELPDSIIGKLEDDRFTEEGDGEVSKRKRKHKKQNKNGKIGGEHAERYHVSLVSPSVVPNFFPTLRVFEYNITGLEDSVLWQDSLNAENGAPTIQRESHHEDVQLELKRRAPSGKKHRLRKGGEKHQDPNLVVPEAPPKESLPGPAHYPQPLTLLGYVQYFANLTHINNEAGSSRHAPARPRPFEYQVEYSTADDELYGLPDLTVKRYLHLAYRMGQRKKSEDLLDASSDQQQQQQQQQHVLGKLGSEASDDVTVDKKHKKHKKHKHRRREENKTWLHFLSHAFVKTVSKEDLEKM
ncbi:hypothetical protein HIM_07970 [Hirsutella minnesotensis 3608]|uniref:Endopolyphosphatase n=1 Tax=Hirsutella minnesotensis 3608 TaxID=1043627 RepID=A0A0F7ZHG7_9HYPO|nr:hypothetical protein HIM_07970 [Hirsutella minnesotensis 3608]